MSGGDSGPGSTYVPGKIRWWLLAVGAVLTLTLVSFGFASSVSSSANQQVQALLDEAGLENVIIDSVDYRSVTLAGPASDQDVSVGLASGVPLVSSVTYTVVLDEEAVSQAGEDQPTEPVAEESRAPVQATAAPEGPAVIAVPEPDPVLFEAGTTDLAPEAQVALDGIADGILDIFEVSPGVRVQLDGYSDSRGPAEENLRLTEQRVESVKAYLVDAGVPEGIIRTESFGELSPVASNFTEAGRALNRRVEITITED